MNRTLRHLLYALAWLLAFTAVIATAFTKSVDLANPGVATSMSQLGSIIWTVGVAVIFYSWARVDAIQHHKSAKVALLFSILSLVLFLFAHIGYLFLTRGVRNGILATLAYICFLLAAAITWFSFTKLLGAFL